MDAAAQNAPRPLQLSCKHRVYGRAAPAGSKGSARGRCALLSASKRTVTDENHWAAKETCGGCPILITIAASCPTPFAEIPKAS